MRDTKIRKRLRKAICIVLSVALINASMPPCEAGASWFSDLMGGLFTVITAPIWVFCPDNPTFRKNNPFRKKKWEEEIDFQPKPEEKKNEQYSPVNIPSPRHIPVMPTPEKTAIPQEKPETIPTTSSITTEWENAFILADAKLVEVWEEAHRLTNARKTIVTIKEEQEEGSSEEETETIPTKSHIPSSRILSDEEIEEARRKEEERERPYMSNVEIERLRVAREEDDKADILIQNSEARKEKESSQGVEATTTTFPEASAMPTSAPTETDIAVYKTNPYSELDTPQEESQIEVARGRGWKSNVVIKWFTATPDEARAMLKKWGLALLGIGASAVTIIVGVKRCFPRRKRFVSRSPSFSEEDVRIPVPITNRLIIDSEITNPDYAKQLYDNPEFALERQYAETCAKNGKTYIQVDNSYSGIFNIFIVNAFLSLLNGEFYDYFHPTT